MTLVLLFIIATTAITSIYWYRNRRPGVASDNLMWISDVVIALFVLLIAATGMGDSPAVVTVSCFFLIGKLVLVLMWIESRHIAS